MNTVCGHCWLVEDTGIICYTDESLMDGKSESVIFNHIVVMIISAYHLVLLYICFPGKDIRIIVYAIMVCGWDLLDQNRTETENNMLGQSGSVKSHLTRCIRYFFEKKKKTSVQK